MRSLRFSVKEVSHLELDSFSELEGMGLLVRMWLSNFWTLIDVNFEWTYPFYSRQQAAGALCLAHTLP